MNNGVIIIGAGGQARVILSTLMALGEKIAGFIDSNPQLLNKIIHGYPVLGDASLLPQLSGHTAIIGIGNNAIRKRIATTYPDLNWQTFIHPTATVHSSVYMGKGTIVAAGAVIQIDAAIGDHSIVNTSASIDHDCRIDDFAHIAPGTRLGGNVKIGEGALIGINSCAIYGMTVGAWSVVGAGSVIVRPIESEVYAKGAPAKAYKKVQ